MAATASFNPLIFCVQYKRTLAFLIIFYVDNQLMIIFLSCLKIAYSTELDHRHHRIWACSGEAYVSFWFKTVQDWARSG